MNDLDGFNYAEYLKRHLMVGQIDPWRETDTGGKLYTLLVTIETALEECSGWSGQDISRSAFVDYLKLNDILVIKSAEDFLQIKEEKPLKFKKGYRKQITEEDREKRRKRMVLLNESKKASIS